MLEKSLESPSACKEIQPVHPKGDQSWVFIGRTDAEAETPVLWLPDGKNWLIGKDPDAGKDWRWEEKRTTNDEMVGWHRWSWVWASSGSWWWTGRPGVLPSVGSQRTGYDWVTELKVDLQCCVTFCYTAKWISCMCTCIFSFFKFPSRLGHLRALSRAFSVLCCFSLIIYFICSGLYLSIPISYFMPLPHSPPWYLYLWSYICVSTSTLQIGSSISFFLDSTYMP